MRKTSSPIPIAYVAVLLAAGVLYVITCAPGALWQDSGLIQYRTWHGDVEGALGLAIAHPLYYLVTIAARALPFGGFGHRVNLVSALAGAVAVANLFWLVRCWLGRTFPALIAAVTFALSHTFWRHACIAETYTLWTALFLGELIVLLRYTQTRRVGSLYALGLLNGLAVAVHMLAVLPLLCYAVLLAAGLARKTIRLTTVGFFVLCWTLGALPYEVLIARNVIDSGDLLGTLASAAFGLRWQADVLNTQVTLQMVWENVLFFVLNFPTVNAALFVVGVAALWRGGPNRPFRRTLAALTALFLLFAFRYTVADRYAFFIPFYCMASLLIGLGADRVTRRMRGKALARVIVALALTPIPIYAALPTVAVQMNLKIGSRGDVPYRDDYRYFLQPWKTGYRGAERYAAEALAGVADHAVIYADTTTVAPLLYGQEVMGLRPDVRIVTGIVASPGAPPYSAAGLAAQLRHGPVYVTSDRPGYAPPFVPAECELRAEGVLWRIVGPQQP